MSNTTPRPLPKSQRPTTLRLFFFLFGMVFSNQSPFCSRFWEKLKDVWPNLAALAQKWANYPTSSTAAERVFATARMLANSQGFVRLPETFGQQLHLTYGLDTLYRLLKERTAKIAYGVPL
jgi:hypothetical protein